MSRLTYCLSTFSACRFGEPIKSCPPALAHYILLSQSNPPPRDYCSLHYHLLLKKYCREVVKVRFHVQTPPLFCKDSQRSLRLHALPRFREQPSARARAREPVFERSRKSWSPPHDFFLPPTYFFIPGRLRKGCSFSALPLPRHVDLSMDDHVHSFLRTAVP